MSEQLKALRKLAGLDPINEGVPSNPNKSVKELEKAVDEQQKIMKLLIKRGAKKDDPKLIKATKKHGDALMNLFFYG